MNLEKVVFGFFVVLAATLNFGFFIGDISDAALHNPYELFAAVLQLVAAALAYGYAEYVSSAGMTAAWTASVVSLSGGALLANLVSVVLLVVETVSFHRG